MKIVSRDYGFLEYRNVEHRGRKDGPMTACKLVAEELGLAERTVEDIWGERKGRLTGSGPIRAPESPGTTLTVGLVTLVRHWQDKELEPMSNSKPQARELHRRFAERRGVSTKTLDRWVEAGGILPEPARIRN